MYYKSSSSVVTLRQFLKELCLFWNLEYRKYTVFRSFLLHALSLTHWAEILQMTLFTNQVWVLSLCVNFVRSYASFWTWDIWNLQISALFFLYWHEILHMTLFKCTSDQVQASSLWANFWGSYASFWTLNIGNTQFSALFSYMLSHIELILCIWLCFNVLQINFECWHFASIFEGVKPLCEVRIWQMCSFPHFSPTRFDIMSWNFAHGFSLKYYRSSSSVINLCPVLKELCFFLNLEYRKYTVFCTFLLHALTYWAKILHRTLF